MKKKQSKALILGISATAVLMFATGLAIFGLSRTVSEIEDAMIAKTPDAILASAGVSEDEDVFLAVNYFDQKSDECINLYSGDKDALAARQFEWSECGYFRKGIEQGLVEFELNEEKLLSGKNGELLTNRGMGDLTRWFEAVDGKSKNYVGSLKLDYQSDGAVFSFYQKDFYPLDEVDFSDGDVVNKNSHNHLFTMNFVVPFTAFLSGDEEFKITADDDTFVYVDDKLVIDMGGIHDAMVGEFMIHEDGEIYVSVDGGDFAYSGVTIEKDSGQNIRIFHADRDSDGSTFGIEFSGMNLNVTDSKLANRQEDGVQVAYDPTNPDYVAPLGETSVTTPDNTKSYIVMATIEGVMVLVFVILMTIAVRSLVKRELSK